MKLCLFLLATALSFNAIAQTICGTANEGESVTLTAPTGMVFTSVTFASYGTPNGSCGSFTTGTCNAANSKSIVEGILVGNNSGTIAATNGLFGDPCGGTVKRLYIEAVYSSAMPLHLVSFTCTDNGASNLLQWQTEDEVNTRSFEVQRSTDGITFATIQTMASNNNNGVNRYTYTDKSLQAGLCFYRLRMIDQDGKFEYSKVIQKEARVSSRLQVAPNPVTGDVTISGTNDAGYLEITTLSGTIVMRIPVTASSQTINLAHLVSGLYILKYTSAKNTSFLKLVKK
jgi:hypothetical protein